MRIILGIALLIVHTASTGLAAGEQHWPQFRGPAGDGHSKAAGLPLTWSETENVVWKTPIHGRAWSSPVVWGDQIWLTTATPEGKELFGICVDRTTGRIVHDLKLFDVAEPQEIHVTNTHASPTPVIEEGRVYLHFGAYGTVCLDTKTAEPVWTRRDLPCNHWRGPGSSPILFEDLLIVHFDGYDYQYVAALNKHTGETVWKKDRDVDYGTDDGDIMKAYSTPIVIEVGGQLQLISPTSKAVVAYDPRTGKELWKVRYKGFSATVRPLFGHGLVYVSTGFGKADLYAIRPNGSGDLTDTHVAWMSARSIPSKPSPLLIGDLLFMVHDQGVAGCFDAKTGEVVWQDRIGGNYSSSPIYADGRIYLFSHEGVATVIAPDRKLNVLAVNKLDSGFRASPAVSGRSLILRTETHLYRLEETSE